MKRILYILFWLAGVPAMAQQGADQDSLLEDSIVKASVLKYRLFSPVTYDRATTGRFLSLDADTTSLIDRTMMRLYLKHPELVASSRGKDSTQTDMSAVAIRPLGKVSLVEKMKELEVKDKKKETTDQLPDDDIRMVVTKPNFWTFSGDYNLQFMQNYISPNWYTSGNSNYSMLGVVTLQYNYNNKQRFKWDNKLEMRLGFLTTQSDTVNTFKASDDLLRYTSQLSFQAYRKWYYAFQIIASTQFTKGLKDNDETVYSDFMSPLNLNLSLGMNYVVELCHKKLTGNVLLAPLSYKLTYCDRKDIVTRFGIEEGKRALNNIGSMVNMGVVWKPLDNFKWESRLYAYTNYKMFQLEFENTFTFQFNRYISAKLYLYPRFDDTAEKVDNTFWQLKENLSIGFSYTM